MQKLRGFRQVGQPPCSLLPTQLPAGISSLFPSSWKTESGKEALGKTKEGQESLSDFGFRRNQTTIKGRLARRTWSESHPMVIIFEYFESKIMETGSFLSFTERQHWTQGPWRASEGQGENPTLNRFRKHRGVSGMTPTGEGMFVFYLLSNHCSLNEMCAPEIVVGG